MIISGGSRCAWRYWAKHLTRTDENERVHVAEIKGLMVETVPDALREMSLIARGSRATNFLYHADINPREDEHLTERQWGQAVDTLERNLGLDDHPRVVVEHEKLGRVHRHVMWLRVAPDTMTVVSDSHDWSRHQATSRELEQAFQLEPVTGVIGRDGKRRPRRPRNYETKRGRETGITPEQVGAELTTLWKQADTGHAFAAAITDRGYILARGDRGYVVLDQAGTTHSLARRIEGARAADVRARMADIDLAALPSVEEARTQARERAAQLRAQGIDPEAPERQEAEAPGEAALSPGDQLAPAAEDHRTVAAAPQEPAPEPVPDKAPPSAPAPLAAEELPPVAEQQPEPFAEPAPASWFAPDKTPPLLPDRFAQLVRDAVRERDTPGQLVPAAPDAFDRLARAMKHSMGLGTQGTARPRAKPDALAPPAFDTFTRLSAAIKQDMRRTAVRPFTGDGLTVWERTAAILAAVAERAAAWTASLVREAGSHLGRLLREEARAGPGDNGRER